MGQPTRRPPAVSQGADGGRRHSDPGWPYSRACKLGGGRWVGVKVRRPGWFWVASVHPRHPHDPGDAVLPGMRRRFPTCSTA